MSRRRSATPRAKPVPAPAIAPVTQPAPTFEAVEPEADAVAVAVAPAMVHPADYRDAIMPRLPTGTYMTADIKVHDGLVDVTVQCGALRWNTVQGLSGRSPDVVGANVETELRAWIKRTFANIFEGDWQTIPMAQWEVSSGRFGRAGRGFQLWLKGDPKAREWLAHDELEAA